MKIKSICAYQVYDSRGNPTVEAEIELESGERGRGMVPSGASTGQFEALELRDGDPNRFRGKSVFQQSPTSSARLPSIDWLGHLRPIGSGPAFDRTRRNPYKITTGANAILAVSMAAATAAAAALRQPLYELWVNPVERSCPARNSDRWRRSTRTLAH